MPFLSEQETKTYQTSPFIDKFSVESFYDLETKTDTETISRAREMDLEHDGENFTGTYDSYEFNLYDTLEEALNNHHKRIDCVEFENLTEDEMKIVNAFVKEKMNDKTYLARYGL